jgi:hypothetical protein
MPKFALFAGNYSLPVKRPWLNYEAMPLERISSDSSTMLYSAQIANAQSWPLLLLHRPVLRISRIVQLSLGIKPLQHFHPADELVMKTLLQSRSSIPEKKWCE